MNPSAGQAVPESLSTDASVTDLAAGLSSGPETATYHLKHGVLSPLETLAQSISGIAPTTTPTLTIPLVFALAGQGTWLAYLLATAGMALVALCIASFARHSASPGSLYIYTRETLPPVFAAVAAWALLFAYVATASSLIAGFVNYSYVLLGHYGSHLSPVLLAAFAAGGAVWLAGRDVKLSARTMLWTEAASVCIIALLIAAVLWRHGFHLDPAQLSLRGVSPSGIRLGALLAVFSFVGFESATTLGHEARQPFRTIPRAVIGSAMLAGLFFLVCAYSEVLSFHGVTPGLGESTAPMHVLSAQADLGKLGPVINVSVDVGVMVSMFAGTLACIIAAARVLMLMAHHGLAHSRLARTHLQKNTPGAAGLCAGIFAFLPVGALAFRGSSPADIYGWMGTLSVYGFVTAYGLVAAALPIHLRRHGRLNAGGVGLSVAATAAMVLALSGTIFPLPPPPYRYFPYLYLLYLALGMVWYATSPRRRSMAA